jgi:hypothetical protein
LHTRRPCELGCPPDPRHGPLCIEVTTGQVLALASASVSGHAVLRNMASGEQVQFPPGHEVTLLLKEKRGIVVLQDGTTQWANKLVKTSVWEATADSKRLLLTRRQDGHHLQWQEEWRQKTLQTASFKVEGRDLSITALRFIHGRHGCTCNMFWDLESVKAALALQGLSPAHLARWLRTGHAKKWAGLLDEWGCKEADELQLISSPIASPSNDIIAMRRTVSTKALLLLAAHWSRTFENAADRTSARSLLEGLALPAAAAGARLKGTARNAVLRARGASCFDLAMESGMLASSELKTSCKWWQAFPAPASFKANFLREESFKVTELRAPGVHGRVRRHVQLLGLPCSIPC